MIPLPISSALERLVGPIEPFFSAHWGRCAAHLGRREQLGDLVSQDGSFSWLQWVHGSGAVDAALRDPTGQTQTQTRIAADHAQEAFERGLTICADVSHVPVVAALLAALDGELRAFCGAAFAKLYVSPAGAGFAPHLDGHHVFVVQLAGRKRWRYEATAALPYALVTGKLDAQARAVRTSPFDGLPLCTPGGLRVSSPAFERGRVTCLAPLEALYLPPGTWHVTEALETSVSLSISPPRTPVTELIVAAVKDALERDEALWQDLVAWPGDAQAGLPPSIRELVARGLWRLRDVVAHLQADDLHLRWARQSFAGTHLAASTAAPVVTANTRLQHTRGSFVWLLGRDEPSSDEHNVFIFRPGTELVLPAGSAKWVQQLAATPIFTVHEAMAFDSTWSEADVLDLVCALVDAGVLEHAG